MTRHAIKIEQIIFDTTLKEAIKYNNTVLHTFSSLSESLSEPPGSDPAPDSRLPVPELVALRPSLTTSMSDVRALVFFHE